VLNELNEDYDAHDQYSFLRDIISPITFATSNVRAKTWHGYRSLARANARTSDLVVKIAEESDTGGRVLRIEVTSSSRFNSGR